MSTLPSKTSTLFDAIAHGDAAHRAWLKQAIDDHFAGRPVQPMRGLGRREAIAAHVVQNVCELPDYNSPDDQPDLVMCTVQELENCVLRAFEGSSDETCDVQRSIDRNTAYERDIKALEELARHLRYCIECSETDVQTCSEGKPLWDVCFDEKAHELKASECPSCNIGNPGVYMKDGRMVCPHKPEFNGGKRP